MTAGVTLWLVATTLIGLAAWRSVPVVTLAIGSAAAMGLRGARAIKIAWPVGRDAPLEALARSMRPARRRTVLPAPRCGAVEPFTARSLPD